MWMPTAVRRRILRYFFQNGIMVVSDNQAGVHEELDCLNIYPFQIGRSFQSRGFAKKQYAWSHAYFVLTNKGIDYLRNFFGAPATAAPLTLNPAHADVLETRREGSRGPYRGQDRGKGAYPPRPRGEGRPERGGFHGMRRGGRDARGGDDDARDE
jgi:small subunit ribosomal protein S10e